MCQKHLEGFVVPDPWIVVTTSPSAREELMDARKIAAAWAIFMMMVAKSDYLPQSTVYRRLVHDSMRY